MSLNNFFQPTAQSSFVSLTLLILRLVFGAAFILHGWGKIHNPLHWMGPHADIKPVFQALAAVSEFGGGIGMVLGFLTRFWSLGLICTMSVAIHTHLMIRHNPFVAAKGGPSYELALVFWAIALMLLAIGPGGISVDAQIFGKKGKK